MGGVKMIESLDSVWFFSNVLSSKKIQSLATLDEDEDDTVNPKLDQTTPITQILETHQPKSQIDDILVPKMESLKPIAQVLEAQKAHLLADEIVGAKYGGDLGCEERKRSKKRVNKKKKKDDDMEVDWAGYDLGFGLGLDDDVNEFWMLMRRYDEEKRLRSQNLPPFSDGLAMKQHLKSWAYAVACNVR